MPWELVRELLGPGLHWGKSIHQLQAAIQEAERRGNPDAAEHIRVILALRNRVMCERVTQPVDQPR